MPYFEGVCFELEYPAHWEAEIIEDIPAFYDPAGAGAIQIASLARDAMPELALEMTRYLARHRIAYESEAVTAYRSVHGQPAMACEFMSQERFWLVTLMGAPSHLLIITYNSDEVPAPEEARTISAVINSVRFFEERI
ncbi:MAG: hypothetical protein HS115_12915 [Spirochaetales bacterium]|nr:hypothetical protein [Spirochaetales bacterium]